MPAETRIRAYIFEPKRIKAFVKAFDALPRGPGRRLSLKRRRPGSRRTGLKSMSRYRYERFHGFL